MTQFKVAGTSKSAGSTKVRYANDLSRVKILAKNGHEDIELVELPNEMSKGEVVKYLMTLPMFTDNAERKMALEEANEKYNVVKVSAPRGRKPKAVEAEVAVAAPEVAEAVES